LLVLTILRLPPGPYAAAGDSLLQAYIPAVAKPVPTSTPTPTRTPLPPIPSVHVLGEDACSRFKAGSAQDPNGEYVCFHNDDTHAVDMTGWRVEDSAAHRYTFPPFVLARDAIVRLHSGPGTNTASDLYWARGLVWNNDHDTVYLFDVFSRLVTVYVY